MRLLTAALLALPVLATPPPVSTSKGFHLLLVPHDGSEANSLQMIHTGAGRSRAVAGELGGDEIVFYVNGTEDGGGTVVTDVGERGFPMAFAFDESESESVDGEEGRGEETGGDGEEGEVVMFPVDITVSTPTKGLSISSAEYDPWLIYSSGGHFFICQQWVDYYRTTYPVLNWSPGEDGPEECVRVGVIPVCEELEELPEGAIGSHEFVVVVRCFVDDQSAGLSTRG